MRERENKKRGREGKKKKKERGSEGGREGGYLKQRESTVFFFVRSAQTACDIHLRPLAH